MILTAFFPLLRHHQSKHQKHQAFEAELSANQSRIDALQKSGQELIDGNHYASDEVSGRMDEVSTQWKKLLEATELKGERLWGPGQVWFRLWSSYRDFVLQCFYIVHNHKC